MHDFKNFPELTTNQMDLYYWQSPHKQIFEDFHAKVTKVHDGDTITLRWEERDFDFPIRFINIAAPELKDKEGFEIPKGQESQQWLEGKLLGEEVDILITESNRVDKWGRLLGNVVFRGVDMGDESMIAGKSVPWAERNEGVIPDLPTIEAMMK